MTPFNYHRPDTVAAALAALAASAGHAKVLAGGQSLLLALKDRKIRPTSLVAINGLPELTGIRHTDDGSLAVGPATRYAALAKTGLPGWHAALGTVAGNLADRSVRNMGTVGGGVCQADPRYDMPAFMAGVAASFVLTSLNDQRILSSEAFFKTTGGAAIAADEILTCILLPPLATWTRVAFEKFCFRTFEAAIVNIAGAVALDAAGRISKLRIAVGGIANAPRLALGTAASLVDKMPAELDIDQVAKQVSNELLPIEDAYGRRQKYQAELIISLTKRILNSLATGGAVG